MLSMREFSLKLSHYSTRNAMAREIENAFSKGLKVFADRCGSLVDQLVSHSGQKESNPIYVNEEEVNIHQILFLGRLCRGLSLKMEHHFGNITAKDPASLKSATHQGTDISEAH